MPSYVITGANRGIGFEFLKQLSADSTNTVITIVRDKKNTEETISKELNRPNIHVVQADLTDYRSLEGSVAEVSAILDGKLDYLIANAGLISDWSGYDSFGVLGKSPEKLTQNLLDCYSVNVIGNVHLFNLYIPLIQKGDGKKVLTLSSGFADPVLAVDLGISLAGPYSASKAAMNMITAKFQAQYQDEGILFLGICPGTVNTGHGGDATPEQLGAMAELGVRFNGYSSRFTGPATPDEAARDVLSVFQKASLEDGYAGGFISHLGKGEKWL